MNENTVRSEVREIIRESLEVDINEIKPEANIIQDLGADSLDSVDMIMNAEKKFNIVIEDEVSMEVKTVKDFEDAVVNKVSIKKEGSNL
jgi:acyl carrier protein